ncbi:Ig-like domain-containing protein [Hymenobacter sp. GOD-10R]|uniref:Ig-like domain-containing protein n=1 Tax=Hymenobacter sp. GOD-10R TaxID=3093922 RepID=UPI002D76DEEA|nr:Ig-like domain-containing protein [Hymenobacter sp. GOD-10R]WRQ28687.1 Ig-like domain-containing protein [Hymenobacter sp. GOD-10R]
MKLILRLAGLLLILVPWVTPNAWAQCTTSTQLSFPTTGVNWKRVTGQPVANSNVTLNTTYTQGSGTEGTLATNTINNVNTLRWDLTYSATNGASHTSVVVFEFSRVVANLALEVQDIDRLSGSQIDRLTFEGLDANNNVVALPVLTPLGTFVSVNGNIATGTGSNGTNATGASVNAVFSTGVKKLRLTFENAVTGNTNPGSQAIGINKMTWCKSPFAVDDDVTTLLNQPVTVDVLSNDVAGDAALSPSTVTLIGTQTGGTFTTNSTTGAVTFVPESNIAGQTQIGYTVKDASGVTSNQGVLTITVTNPPTANSDDAQTPQNAALNNINVLGNDTGGSGVYAIDPTTVTLVGAQTGGTFTRNTTTGTISYTPTTGFVGAASVNYTVRNKKGEISNQATLSIIVTKAPTAVADGVSISYNAGATTVDVIDNDTPASSDAPNVINPNSITLSGTTGTNGGTFAVSNGKVIFTPPAASSFPNNTASRATSVNYTVKNNASPAQTSNSVAVTVTLTNTAPVVVADNVATVRNRAMTNIKVLANDADADGNATIDKSTVTLVGTQTGGTFTVNTAAGPNQGTINFTPTNNSTTTASVQYTVKDEKGVVSNTVFLTIAVTTTTVDVVTTLSGPTSASSGSYVTYTVTVKNNSTADATNVSPRVQLPTGLQTVTASLDATYNPSSGIVVFPSVTYAANSTVQTATVRFVMPANGSVTGMASSISSSTAFTTASNDDGTSTASNVTTTATQVADVAATITGPTATAPGGKTVLNIVASNYGPSAATNVLLRATISKNLTNVTVSDGGSYDATTGVITLPAITSLASSASTGFTVSLTAPKSSDQPVIGSVNTTAATADPAASNNDGSASFSNIRVAISNTVSSQACLTTSTTDVTTAANQQINTYYKGVGSAAANSTTLAVGPALSTVGAADIVPGDLLLIIQMQGAQIDYSNTNAYGDGIASTDSPANGTLGTGLTAGLYEYRYVDATSASATAAGGGTLTLSSPLTSTYTNANATTAAGQQRFQVIRVPRYRNLTLGADLVPAAWNGETGGIVVLEVGGTLNFNGYTINASGKGFRGGAGRTLAGTTDASVTNLDYVTSSSLALNGSKGEGIAGTPRYVNNNGALLDNTAEGYPGGSYGRGAPGNAGGGGTDGTTATNANNTGGGGGSNGGFGGQGGNSWNQGAPTGGNGGAPFLQASPSRVVLGGGGGAGTTNNGTGTPANGLASSGTAGGGIVIVNTNQVAGTGTINVSGIDNTFTVQNDGAGGGGAGGSVVFLAQGTLSNIIVLAKGGQGGSDNLAPQAQGHGPGGGGSAGVVFTSSAINSSSEIASGASGQTGGSNGNFSFGGTTGTQFAGLVRNTIAQADVPNITQASNCTVQPLPVELVQFDAKAQGRQVQLNWSTASEKNADYFAVERSIDSYSFEQIGKVASYGTTTDKHGYAFTDQEASRYAGQVLYYRLRQVDLDGATTYSPVRSVALQAGMATFDLSPNPTSDYVTLDLTALPAGQFHLSFHDVSGRNVGGLEQDVKGGQPTTLNVAILPAGVYIVTLQGVDKVLTRRLVKH